MVEAQATASVAGWTAGRLGACARVARGRETEYPLPRTPSSVRLSASSLSRLPEPEKDYRSLRVTLSPSLSRATRAISLALAAIRAFAVCSVLVLLSRRARILPLLSLPVPSVCCLSLILLRGLSFSSFPSRSRRAAVEVYLRGTSPFPLSLSLSHVPFQLVPAVRLIPCPPRRRYPPRALRVSLFPTAASLYGRATCSSRETAILPRPERRHTYTRAPSFFSYPSPHRAVSHADPRRRIPRLASR